MSKPPSDTPLRVAVVTPYYKETPDLIEQAHQSVQDQTFKCTHVVVSDGCPLEAIDSWQVDHIRLPRSHKDIGSTPRLIGAFHAIGMNFDAIAFLDADNWYHVDHIATIMECWATTKAAFVSSSRMLCRLDGTPMAICHLTDQNSFIDTSCMVFFRPAFSLLTHWVLMPSYAHTISDRVILHYLHKSGLSLAHTALPSVNYRCSKAGLYRFLNEPIPKGVQPRPDYDSSFQQWEADGNPPLNMTPKGK